MFIAGQEIQMEGENGRFKSRVRGWRKGGYILIDMDYTTEPGASLKTGDEMVARFFMGGEPFGFVTTLLQFLYNHSLALLAYPERVERNSERRSERVPVSIPVEILQILAGHELEEWRGVIRDISHNGARIISPRPAAVNETLFLTFTPGEGGEVDNAQAVVRRIARIQEGYELGLDFVSLGDDNERTLSEFLEMAAARMEASP